MSALWVLCAPVHAVPRPAGSGKMGTLSVLGEYSVHRYTPCPVRLAPAKWVLYECSVGTLSVLGEYSVHRYAPCPSLAVAWSR